VIKRLIVVVASSAAILSNLIATPIAHANLPDGRCTWKLSGIPARYRIGIDRPTVRIGGTCTRADNWFGTAGVFRVIGPTDRIAHNQMQFFGCSAAWVDPDTGRCMVIGDQPPPREYDAIATAPFRVRRVGKMLTVPVREWAIDDGDTHNADGLFRNQYFTAKLATTTTLSVTRHGEQRTFTITARHYSLAVDRFISTADPPIYLQRYIDGSWSTFRTLESSKSSITYTVRLAKAYKWRARTPATKRCWESRSATTVK
jgi:hypothetical protein